MELHLEPCASHADGWGPATSLKDEALVPFALFNKSDRIGRPADFVSTQQYDRRDRYTAYGATSAAFSYAQQEDETSFSLVDTKPRPKPKFGIQRIGGTRGRGGRGGRGRGGNWSGGFFGPGGVRFAPDIRQGTAPPTGPGQQDNSQQQQGQKKKNKAQRGWENRRRFGPRDWDRAPRVNLPSIIVQPAWVEVAQLTIAQLEAASLPFLEKTSGGKKMKGRADDSSEDEASKVLRESQSVQTLYECGAVHKYDKGMDRITNRTSAKLRVSPQHRFAGIRPSDDYLMKKLAKDGAGNIYATDTVLSLLMAAPRSVNSWDIIVRKTSTGTWLDRRPTSLIGHQTVNETGQDMNEEEPALDSVNHPTQLMHEATGVQRDFVVQALKGDVGLVFADERPPTGSSAPTSAYRYRRFELGEGKRVIARSEIQAVVEMKAATDADRPLTVSLRCLLETESATKTGADWHQKIDTQRGYIVATEFRYNSCKVTRWIAQAMLSGVDEMRVGFVSRKVPGDPKQHSVLGVQRLKPNEFAQQVGVRPSSLWGSLDLILNTVKELENGSYLIFRDPNEAVVRFFSVPTEVVEQ